MMPACAACSMLGQLSRPYDQLLRGESPCCLPFPAIVCLFIVSSLSSVAPFWVGSLDPIALNTPRRLGGGALLALCVSAYSDNGRCLSVLTALIVAHRRAVGMRPRGSSRSARRPSSPARLEASASRQVRRIRAGIRTVSPILNVSSLMLSPLA